MHQTDPSFPAAAGARQGGGPDGGGGHGQRLQHLPQCAGLHVLPRAQVAEDAQEGEEEEREAVKITFQWLLFPVLSQTFKS